MTEPRVVMGKPSRKGWAPSARSTWRLLAGLGALFVVVGGADLALTWLPLGFGNPEWEFGTVTSMMDGLPVPTLGLVALVAAGQLGGSRVTSRIGSVLLAVFALWVVAAAILYATTVPLALRAVTEPVIRSGLNKAVIKTALQSVVYPIGLIWLAVAAWRRP
jgi:hypothetical protein